MPFLRFQDSYWNYGAASAKWVPPEHRARGRSGAAVPLHLAVKDACYTWDESAAAVRQHPLQHAITTCAYILRDVPLLYVKMC